MGKMGIAIKFKEGEGEIHIQPETLITYLSQLPRDEKGWVRLEATVRDNPGFSSHQLRFMQPSKPEYRQTKITGPTHYKKAG